MIVLSTYNCQRAGSAKVHMLADLLLDDDFQATVLAVQELDLPATSAASFKGILRDRGIYVYFSEPDNGVYRCALLSVVPGAAVSIGCERVAAASFEFVNNGQFCRLVIAGHDGCAWDQDVALRGAEQLVQQLRQTREAWVILGDFNLEAMQEPFASRLAAGLALLEVAGDSCDRSSRRLRHRLRAIQACGGTTEMGFFGSCPGCLHC